MGSPMFRGPWWSAGRRPGPRVGVALLGNWFHHMVENHAMFHERRGTAAGRAGDPLPPSPMPGLAFDALSTSGLVPQLWPPQRFGPARPYSSATTTQLPLQRGLGCMLGLVNDAPPEKPVLDRPRSLKQPVGQVWEHEQLSAGQYGSMPLSSGQARWRGTCPQDVPRPSGVSTGLALDDGGGGWPGVRALAPAGWSRGARRPSGPDG